MNANHFADPATRSAYETGFARFYDRYYTGWTDEFGPGLVDLFDTMARPAEGVPRALDIGCGSGKLALALAESGWQVLGYDLSPEMVGIATARLAGSPYAGAATFEQRDCASFDVSQPVDAVVAAEAPINHLLTPEAVRSCFASVAAALRPGGLFVFDLYEPAHFRHWNSIVVHEDDSSLMVKRGMWDDTAATGVRRMSGAVDTDGGVFRFAQSVYSRAYPEVDVERWLRDAGLSRLDSALPVPACGCAKPDVAPCRIVYVAVRS